MVSRHHGSIGAIAVLLMVCASKASGHYLWVAVDDSSGSNGTANVYFEESAAPGDGHYLDPFVKHGKLWMRTITSPKPELIPMQETTKEKFRWLSAAVPAAAPRSIDSYGKFGVYRYGKTDVLLHYYARNLQVDSHEDLHELSRAKQLDLDIVPHDDGDSMELTLLWKGKPAVNSTMLIRGPKGFQENPKTDEHGRVRFTVREPGRYVFRTNVEEAVAGKENGQDYSLIRHHATMLITLPMKK